MRLGIVFRRSGAVDGGGGSQYWMMEMGDIASVLGNTFFYIDIVHLVMHNFYILKNQRQKLGEAVAWASVSPLPLHCPIHHGGINT